MLPAILRIRSFLVPAGFKRLSLIRMGILYMAAAFFQAGWLLLVVINHIEALRFIEIPVIGWAMFIIWALMAWCVPHLIYVGFQILRLGYDQQVDVIQSPREKKLMYAVALILALGIVLDIILLPFMLGVKDTEAVLFLSALMGGRVLRGNVEAVLLYHRL